MKRAKGSLFRRRSPWNAREFLTFLFIISTRKAAALFLDLGMMSRTCTGHVKLGTLRVVLLHDAVNKNRHLFSQIKSVPQECAILPKSSDGPGSSKFLNLLQMFQYFITCSTTASLLLSSLINSFSLLLSLLCRQRPND